MALIETRDGTSLFYVDGGTGPPVVFVAAAWLASPMWEFQLPALMAAGCRSVAYDRRGHGRSDWPFAGYDYDTLADDLADLLERRQLRDVTLVAYSMGGGEAVRYLTRYGTGRVSRLVLAAATVPFPMHTDDNSIGIDRQLMEADLAERTGDRPRWYARQADGFFGIGLPGISVSPELRDFLIRQCLDCSPSAARELFRSGFTTDFRAELQAITVPTLIVHGDHDLQAPLDICGRVAARLIPGSTLHVYENAAHGLFVTHAQRFSEDLLNFSKCESAK